MMTTKFADRVLSGRKPDGDGTEAGLDRALDHVEFLHKKGVLSSDERDRAVKAATREYMNTCEMEDYVALRDSGEWDKMEDATAFARGEDPKVIAAQDVALLSKVSASFVLSAWKAGASDAETTIDALKQFVALPEGADEDAEGALNELLAQTFDPDAELEAPPEEVPVWARPCEPVSEDDAADFEARQADNTADTPVNRHRGEPEKPEPSRHPMAVEGLVVRDGANVDANTSEAA